MEIYKVWGQQFTFPEYKHQQVDWSSFYFQHNVKHALRYLSKKWEDGFTTASLIKATMINPQIKLIKIQNEQFGNHKISGHDKCQLAKKILMQREQIDLNEELLMKGLGKRNKILQVLDAQQFEVIVPHEVFIQNNFKVQIVVLFKNSLSQSLLTQKYSKYPFEKWTNIIGDAKYQPYLAASEFEK